jgi:hypothetical protein
MLGRNCDNCAPHFGVTQYRSPLHDTCCIIAVSIRILDYAATLTEAETAKKAAYMTMSGLPAFGGGTGW